MIFSGKQVPESIMKTTVWDLPNRRCRFSLMIGISRVKGKIMRIFFTRSRKEDSEFAIETAASAPYDQAFEHDATNEGSFTKLEFRNKDDRSVLMLRMSLRAMIQKLLWELKDRDGSTPRLIPRAS